jgi:RNA polymerase sigma factor (sigma-70 family)
VSTPRAGGDLLADGFHIPRLSSIFIDELAHLREHQVTPTHEPRMTMAFGSGLQRVAARLNPDTAPDGELLARFLASRDEAAFALLVRRHGSMVLSTCRRVLGNAADADDAFQAAFVVLVRKSHSLTNRSCVGNFLYGVAFHTALKARAMATKRRAKEAKASRERERPESDELSRVLDEELTKLPDKYREPVVLCELEGVSRKDAAARLGIPEGTISSRLTTAHRMLAKRLTAKGFAAVAVAAVLGNQASAVPDVLAEAALRAATDGPPAAVTKLATEVTKMLLWTNLKAGAVLTGVLLACGVGFGLVAKGFADDQPAVKAPVPKKEKKPEADKSYSLKDGELVKFISPPFPDERDEVFKRVWPSVRGEPKGYRMVAGVYKANYYSVGLAMATDGGRPLLEALKDIFDIDGMDCVGNVAVLESRFDADILVHSSTAGKLLPAFQAELKAKCGIDVKLEFRQIEREVVVAGGTYARRLRPPGVPEARHRIDLYADQLLAKPSQTEFAHAKKLMSEIGKYVGRSVIDETNLKDLAIQFDVAEHDRTPATEKTLAEDRNPAKVIKNLEEQTGLTFKLEKRKVRTLVVEHVEVKKER